MNVNLDDLACTPQLDAGDLLLMRNDMFHRTQDNDTARVALSVRAAYSSAVVKRAQLANGGLAKAARMAKARRQFESMFRAFDEAGQDEMALGEFLAAARAIESRPGPRDAERFSAVLLREKIRNGVLWSSLRAAAGELLVRPVVKRYHRYRLRRADALTPMPAKPKTT